MEELRRARRPLRWEFEKLHGELETLLQEEEPDKEEITVKFRILTDNFEILQAHDARIMEQMTKDAIEEQEENAEFEEILDFKYRFEKLYVKKKSMLPNKNVPYPESVTGSEKTEVALRNFKLPTIQMKKFSGKLTDWLAWWAQFQKIDEDPHMHGSDKFWYLLQSLEVGTDAYEIATGYPQSNENYSKVIAAIKKQYGNEDLLLQVYIRQLLNLVISNAHSKEKIPVKSLYIKLDSHLRALKTLNLQKADPETWLFPLVESSLPERILDNWQRSSMATNDKKDKQSKTRLESLMSFLEREVEIKQRIDITREFTNEQVQGKKSEQKYMKTGIQQKQEKIPTLSSFYNTDKRQCAFCQKNNHESRHCYRAKEMPYEARIDILKKKNLCFRCCGLHHSRSCNADKVECQICKKRHFTILCRDYKFKRSGEFSEQPPSKRPKITPNQIEVNPTNVCVGSSTEVALQTLRVNVTNGVNKATLRAFIDSGCDKSYISTQAAKKLNLRANGCVKSIHSLFGGHQTSTIVHNKYEINLSSFEENFQINVEVREQHYICGALPNVVIKQPSILRELKENAITLTDLAVPPSQIDLLIGADIYAHIITGKFVKLKCGAAAILTKLGWTIIGELNQAQTDHVNLANACISMCVNNQHLASLWELETLGIREPAEETAIRRRLELAKENYVQSITRGADGRYVARLPWKEDIPSLPTNRDVALKRLQSATKKLIDNGLFSNYDSIFKEWLANGFIEEVPVNCGSTKIHYLPHRPVIKMESLTTPVRPVYDASCRVGKSPSLNDCLYTGENCGQLIIDILFRFREKTVAFIADVKKAFQMIGLVEEDRDVVRFLWWRDNTMSQIVEYRHARVVFGVTSSPFILAAVLYHHLSTLPEVEREMGMKLLSTMYVDNVANSENTIEEYHRFKQKSVELMNEAAMDLRMWQSNVEDLSDEKCRVVSVLGYLWDRQNDSLFINTKGLMFPDKITKRSILSTIQKIYDPLGFVSPCLLPMKILLQKTWLTKAKWDQELPDSDKKTFQEWYKEARDIEKFWFPRHFTKGEHNKGNWHFFVFNDGSKDGYGSCVYLRTADENRVSVQLLYSKSRVAPVKKMTIPKLELMACLLGVRLLNTVKKALNLYDVPETYLTDSTTAHAWITRNIPLGPFIGNRVKEINEKSSTSSWRHVPGRHNPADIPSRGCKPSLLMSIKWWEGPFWLYLDESEWPTEMVEYNEEEIVAEQKKTATITSTAVSFSVIQCVQNSHSFTTLIRIIGWVRRFLFNKMVKNENMRRSGPLRKEELDKAEIILIREIQTVAFPTEERDKLKGLEVFEDQWGVLRIKTRLTYREDLGNFRFPMLLPNNRDEVRRLILDTHRAFCHAGVGFLMTKLRGKYWIIKGRHTIRSVLYKCKECRRFSAKPVIPAPAPLPIDRIKEAEVFEIVGVDLAGPMHLRNGSKAWLVIFTCAVYRAVHFELVKKISTTAFISALETFSEKYRRPAIIYSDNGTNFRGADNLFKRINWDTVSQDEKLPSIKWKFNPVTSSWWGGWWERLIRTAKDMIRRTVGKGSLNWNELRAILKTVAEVMNSRPLTYVSEDPEDLEPLTPSLFLHPFGVATFPEGEATQAERLRLRLRYVNNLRKELKERFRKEYLSMLINRNPKKVTRDLRLGELVFVGNDSDKRIEWPLGRVIEIIPGRDGITRLAKVRTAKGEILRSVQRLYPVEGDAETATTKTIRDRANVRRSGRIVRRPERFE